MKVLPLLLMPCLAFAQKAKIKVNEVDKFTNQKRIETNKVFLIEGITWVMRANLRSVDSTYYLNLDGSIPSVGIINETCKLIILLKDSSTISLYSKGLQTYTLGGSFDNKKVFDYEYRISLADMEKLKQAPVKAIRLYYTDSYADANIPDKKDDRLQKLATTFLNQLSAK